MLNTTFREHSLLRKPHYVFNKALAVTSGRHKPTSSLKYVQTSNVKAHTGTPREKKGKSKRIPKFVTFGYTASDGNCTRDLHLFVDVLFLIPRWRNGYYATEAMVLCGLVVVFKGLFGERE